ncbi:MAG: ABC transporter ATP-binding protein, partial [Candidatus Methanomethylophilaceae archaeon]|nr:ABC transporter ATP-binding protein [Candidatus Methanomethylophilaceae archaeon]
LCDRIAILNHGKIIAQGTPEQLCEDLGRWAVEYIIDGVKKYRYFTDRDESKTFRDSLDENVQVTSRLTNL